MVKTGVKKAVMADLKNVLKQAVMASKFEEINEQQLNDWLGGFLIETPADDVHGDFATNVAMVGAKILKKSPKIIAEKILNNISVKGSNFVRCEFAMPGFINFFINNAWFESVLNIVLSSGGEFGKLNLGQGKTVLVEYVSANPTGPMHVGNARGGAIGDCLAEILSFAGFLSWR